MSRKFNVTQILDGIIEMHPPMLEGIILKTKKHVYGHSAEEMLAIGREYISNEDYLKAMIVFHEIGKTDGRMRTLAREFYEPIIFTIVNSNKNIHDPMDDVLTDELICCMAESTRMYSKKEMSKEELFEIETLIDKVDYKNMRIKESVEFERIYCKFKEYCMDIYIDENDKEKE